jgi:DNA-directed RNA polymerase specialized sigma24 family protein
MIAKVAQAFRTDSEELEAELASKLCELKSRKLYGIRDWKRYLAKFLYNKASDFVRRRRLSESKMERYQVLGEMAWPEQHFALEPHEGSATDDLDPMIDFARMWRTLDPELQRFWQTLLEEGGNRTRTAKRCGKHRNTVRLWIEEIRSLLEKHDISEP